MHRRNLALSFGLRWCSAERIEWLESLHSLVASLIDSRGKKLYLGEIMRPTSRARPRRAWGNCYTNHQTQNGYQMRYEQTIDSTQHTTSELDFPCPGGGLVSVDLRGAEEPRLQRSRVMAQSCSRNCPVASVRSRMLGARHPSRRSSGEAREGLWNSCLARPSADLEGPRMPSCCRCQSSRPVQAAVNPLPWALEGEGEDRCSRHHIRRPNRRHHNYRASHLPTSSSSAC